MERRVKYKMKAGLKIVGAFLFVGFLASCSSYKVLNIDVLHPGELNIGNKNAVVNNMQIIEGIKQGVSEAMRGVQGGGDSHITINLDGKVVYDNVVQRNNEHVAMTGESEFAY